jgi:glutaredoxin-related protein
MSEKEQTFERIREEVTGNDVVLFMKGTPVFPRNAGSRPPWCRCSRISA